MKKYKESELLNICPSCGYDKLFESPFDTYGYPSHEICPCCGFEFGFDDSNKGSTYETYRNEWINKGFKFFSKERPLKKWNKEIMKNQLKNIEKVKHYEPYL
jgi:ribosomal protein L32